MRSSYITEDERKPRPKVGEGAANMQNGRETTADTDQRRGGALVALT